MTDIFDADVPAQDDDHQIDPDKDYFSEYVGEGKKYRDERALARAKAEADAHIARIERENAQLREQTQQSKTVEDLLDQIRSENQSHRQDEPNHGSENGSEKQAEPQGATQVDIEELVEKKLAERQTAEQRARNTQWVRQQLEQKYGADYQNHLLRIAKDLDMTKEELQEIAGARPKAFMRLVDEAKGPAPRSSAPPTSQVNTQTVPTHSGQKTYSYYQRIKKENPALYDSVAIQAEMHQEALKQGAAFFD